MNSVKIALSCGALVFGVVGCGRSSLEDLAASSNSSSPATASGPTLDVDWGVGGVKLIDFGSSSQALRALAQSDGRTLVAGSHTLSGLKALSVTRLLSSGDLDTSYGTNGKIISAFASSVTDQLNAVAFKGSDGTVFGVGKIGSDFAVARYLPSGALDTAFGGTGLVQTSLSAGTDIAYGVIAQADGKPIVVGESNVGSGNSNFAIVRYLTNGSVDPCFGDILCIGGGKVVLDFNLLRSDGARAVTIDSSGSIYVGGYTTSLSGDANFAIVKLSSSGLPDVGFGLLGFSAHSLSSRDDLISTLVLQTDGKILVAGYSVDTALSNRRVAVSRLTANGILDTAFGTSGSVTVAADPTYDSGALSLLVSPSDGKILVGGYSNDGTRDQMLILRLTSTGALDTNFSSSGLWKNTPANAGGASRIHFLIYNTIGQVLAPGYATEGGYDVFSVLRLIIN